MLHTLNVTGLHFLVLLAVAILLCEGAALDWFPPAPILNMEPPAAPPAWAPAPAAPNCGAGAEKVLDWLVFPLCPNMLGLLAAPPPPKLNVGGLAAAAPKLKPELVGPDGAGELVEPPPPPKAKTPPAPPCC